MEGTVAFQKGCLRLAAVCKVINTNDFTVNLSITDGASRRL